MSGGMVDGPTALTVSNRLVTREEWKTGSGAIYFGIELVGAWFRLIVEKLDDRLGNGL